MIEIIYIEEDVIDHPRTGQILDQFPSATKIICSRYTEIFNKKSQNFRLQKIQPALILARKFKNLVLPTPSNYGIGAEHNYYFSHMMNCIYDCRYCFLQGMYRSAHYVVFVNFEDFAMEIKSVIDEYKNQAVHFFSGYDCDSLALEPVTGFIEFILPVFNKYKSSLLELRTKSTQIRTLLNQDPIDNVVIAYSFTPEEIADVIEHKTPVVQKRIDALVKLQNAGWKLGLRFDPLIYVEDYKINYQNLIESIFTKLDESNIHSVSLGGFRLPKDYFKKIYKLYPDELLFASPFTEKEGMVSYQSKIADEMYAFCSELLLNVISKEKFFPCHETIVS